MSLILGLIKNEAYNSRFFYPIWTSLLESTLILTYGHNNSSHGIGKQSVEQWIPLCLAPMGFDLA